MGKQHSLSVAIAASVCASMLALAACNQQPAQNQANAPASSGTAPASSASAAGQQAAAYTPPTADQLYQMVAPIALFPDKLVAQVLAGSTYPDQITAAENLLTQNPNLKGDLLQAAVEPQSWDASVKGLTQFPSVLSQMAQNVQWTTALGEAYVNDPTDVLNAIQVMRQRAQAQGNLSSSAQQQVSVQPVQQVQQSEQASGEVVSSSEPPVYSGPDVVPAPAQVIQIEPAQPDAVYVPSYDPQTVYGGDMAVYPSYEYAQPAYTTGQIVTVGAVAFGAAIVVGALLDHGGGGGGGWHSWGMNWGGGYQGGGGYNGGGGGWHRPAVVYNNQTYVSRSTTVINRYTTNNITNNRYNNVNNNNSVHNNYVNNNRAINNNTSNVTDNHNQFNRNVANNNHPAGQPMSVPNFARAGYPAASTPQQHAAQAERPAQAPHPGEAPRPNIVHPPAAQAAAARPQESFRQPAQATHPAPQAQPRPAQQAHAQPAARPAPQPHAQPAARPAQQPHPQPAARPAEEVRRPAPAQHAAPPRPQPHPQPQARPAPQHQNNEHRQPPPKKKDDSQH